MQIVVRAVAIAHQVIMPGHHLDAVDSDPRHRFERGTRRPATAGAVAVHCILETVGHGIGHRAAQALPL